MRVEAVGVYKFVHFCERNRFIVIRTDMQKLHTGFARHGAEADFFQERVLFSAFCTFQRSAHAVLSDKIRLADHESVAQLSLMSSQFSIFCQTPSSGYTAKSSYSPFAVFL